MKSLVPALALSALVALPTIGIAPSTGANEAATAAP